MILSNNLLKQIVGIIFIAVLFQNCNKNSKTEKSDIIQETPAVASNTDPECVEFVALWAAGDIAERMHTCMDEWAGGLLAKAKYIHRAADSESGRGSWREGAAASVISQLLMASLAKQEARSGAFPEARRSWKPWDEVRSRRFDENICREGFRSGVPGSTRIAVWRPP